LVTLVPSSEPLDRQPRALIATALELLLRAAPLEGSKSQPMNFAVETSRLIGHLLRHW
jgi:hypothetical protein